LMMINGHQLSLVVRSHCNTQFLSLNYRYF